MPENEILEPFQELPDSLELPGSLFVKVTEHPEKQPLQITLQWDCWSSSFVLRNISIQRSNSVLTIELRYIPAGIPFYSNDMSKDLHLNQLTIPVPSTITTISVKAFDRISPIWPKDTHEEVRPVAFAALRQRAFVAFITIFTAFVAITASFSLIYDMIFKNRRDKK